MVALMPFPTPKTPEGLAKLIAAVPLPSVDSQIQEIVRSTLSLASLPEESVISMTAGVLSVSLPDVQGRIPLARISRRLALLTGEAIAVQKGNETVRTPRPGVAVVLPGVLRGSSDDPPPALTRAFLEAALTDATRRHCSGFQISPNPHGLEQILLEVPFLPRPWSLQSRGVSAKLRVAADPHPFEEGPFFDRLHDLAAHATSQGISCLTIELQETEEARDRTLRRIFGDARPESINWDPARRLLSFTSCMAPEVIASQVSEIRWNLGCNVEAQQVEEPRAKGYLLTSPTHRVCLGNWDRSLVAQSLPSELRARPVRITGSRVEVHTGYRHLPAPYVRKLFDRLKMIGADVALRTARRKIPLSDAPDIGPIIEACLPDGYYLKGWEFKDGLRISVLGGAPGSTALADAKGLIEEFVRHSLAGVEGGVHIELTPLKSDIRAALQSSSTWMQRLFTTSGCDPDGNLIAASSNSWHALEIDLQGIGRQTVVALQEAIDPPQYRLPPSAAARFRKARSVTPLAVDVISFDRSGAKIPEDGYSVSKLPDGGYRVGVHLSRTSLIVPPGSAEAEQAIDRVQSLYSHDGHMIPMLPRPLLYGHIALHCRKIRPCINIFFTISPDRQVIDGEIIFAPIKNNGELTFDAMDRKITLGSDETTQKCRMLRDAVALLTHGKPGSATGLMGHDIVEKLLSASEEVVRKVFLQHGVTWSCHRLSGAARDIERLAAQWLIEGIYGHFPLPNQEALLRIANAAARFRATETIRRSEHETVRRIQAIADVCRRVGAPGLGGPERVQWGTIQKSGDAPGTVVLSTWDNQGNPSINAVIDERSGVYQGDSFISGDDSFRVGEMAAGELVGVNLVTGAPIVKLRANFST